MHTLWKNVGGKCGEFFQSGTDAGRGNIARAATAGLRAFSIYTAAACGSGCSDPFEHNYMEVTQ